MSILTGSCRVSIYRGQWSGHGVLRVKVEIWESISDLNLNTLRAFSAYSGCSYCL